MITRVWVGKEQEGFQKDVYTMFIEGVTLDAEDIIKFITNFNDNPVTRLYLGAGGKGLMQLTNYDLLLLFVENKNIDIMVELYNDQYNLLPIQFLSHKKVMITYTIYSKLSSLIDYFKIDTGEEVGVVSLKNCNLSTNSLEELRDGLYSTDKLIFKREGENK